MSDNKPDEEKTNEPHAFGALFRRIAVPFRRLLLWCNEWDSVINLVSSVFGILSLIAAVIAIFVSTYQWREDVIASNEDTQNQIDQYHKEVQHWQEEEKRWQEEGAVFSLMRVTKPDEEVDIVNNDKTGDSYRQLNSVLVVSNTGRTQGTIIEIREAAPDDDEELIMCVPNVNQDGILSLGSLMTELPNFSRVTHTFGSEQVQTSETGNIELTVGERQMTLQPGESRLIILAGKPHREADEDPEPYMGKYDVYTADGKKSTLQQLTAGSILSEHYESLLGLTDARIKCSAIAEQQLDD